MHSHSGLNCSELQRRRCTRWAEDLGWTACSVRGANMYDRFPSGKGCKCTFSWVMAQLPKLMAMLEPFPDSAVAVIVEDSVHLTREVTPSCLYSLYSQYGNVWAGGVMLTSKGNGFELVDGSGLLQESHTTATTHCRTVPSSLSAARPSGKWRSLVFSRWAQTSAQTQFCRF